jgi:hypothetical protein
MTAPEQEPEIDVAHGDPAVSAHLRRSLTLLRDKASNDEFKDLVNDILKGKRRLREAFSSPEFQNGIDPYMRDAKEKYESMSEEEKTRLVAQGRQELQEERERIEREKQD